MCTSIKWFLNVLFFLPPSDVEKYKNVAKIITNVISCIFLVKKKNYLRKVWPPDHKLKEDFHVRSRLIFLVKFEIKTKFASMRKNKSFSRDLYLPLQKQIRIISILPNEELLKHSIIKCGGPICNFINA